LAAVPDAVAATDAEAQDAAAQDAGGRVVSAPLAVWAAEAAQAYPATLPAVRPRCQWPEPLPPQWQ
jgi:hypothetical protein